MSTAHGTQNISCGRCQTKKIRCNRATPQCDKCEAAGAECLYSPRKPRSKKLDSETSERLLWEVLDRLKRLEEQVGLDTTSGTEDNAYNSTVSITGSGAIPTTRLDQDPDQNVPSVIRDIVDRIQDDDSRSMLLSNVFCHLRQVDSRLFENNRCTRALTSAVLQIESTQEKQCMELLDPVIPKDLAKRLIESKSSLPTRTVKNLTSLLENYGCHQFEGFKFPLEKSFLASIPDLIEIPHVQLDCTSQIIYYSVLLRGIVLDPDSHPARGSIIEGLYLKCLSLSDEWVRNIQNTAVDLLAASLLMSVAIEGCNIDLAWRAFSHSCTISRALGYFSVDEAPREGDSQLPTSVDTSHEAEVERNRKRFGFWHILRTDCLFRMSFGMPSLIPAGSWTVNFPDPTINGVDDEASRFIEIHFLISMRLALIVTKYLDWTDGGAEPDPVSHDAIIDSYIDDVQSILSDWDTASLLQMAVNDVDKWLCVDVLFSSYKMLIVLYQSKRCDQGHRLSYKSVDLARKSVQIFQSLLSSSSHAFWGIGVILLYQILPFFILCLDIIGNPDLANLDADVAFVCWVGDYVEMVAEGRIELKPVTIFMREMINACQ